MMTLIQTIRKVKAEGFSPEILAKYSKDEIYAIQKILGEVEETGYSETLDSLWKNDFDEMPVSIDEFLDNDFYLGKVGKDIYPIWRKDLRKVLSPYEEIGELILRGGIGSGKTTVAVVALLYKIYYLTCLKNPQRFYDLIEGSPLVFGLFSVYKYLVKATSYQYFLTWIRDLSPYFRRWRILEGKDNKTSERSILQLPKNIGIALGATAIGALGQNVFGGLCFSGDTKIPLLNGTKRTLKDLTENCPKEFWVYSVDKDGKIIPSLATALKTRRSAILEIELDSGEKIRCTPDHLFMLRDGSYKKAKDIVPNYSLMPFYRRLNDKGYEEVKHPNGKWQKTHQMVGTYFGGEDLYKYPVPGEGPWVLHHKDLDKRNNNPDNLELQTFKYHSKLHQELVAKMHTPEARAKWKASMEKKHADPVWLKKRKRISSETMKRNWDNYRKGIGCLGDHLKVHSKSHTESIRKRIIALNKTPEARKRSGDRFRKWNLENKDLLRKRGRTIGAVALKRWMNENESTHKSNSSRSITAYNKSRRYDITFEDITDVALFIVNQIGKLTLYSMANFLGCNRSVISRRLREANISFKMFKEVLNHKVVSVLKIDSVEDMYCLNTTTGNFALSSGVFVHNCDETEFGRKSSLTSSEKSQVQDLYHNVRTRMDSRFIQAGGSNPGLLLLVSSARDYSQFLDQHVKAVESDPHTYVCSYALYEVKEHVFKKSPRFTVIVGDKLHRSYILEDDPKKVVRPDSITVKVPKEFLPAFRYDLDTALRDISGIPTYGHTLFLPRRDLLLNCYENSVPRKHPFTQEEIVLSLEDDIYIEDFFVKDELIRMVDRTAKVWQPKFHPYADRYIHVDLAKNRDCAGLTMCCISSTKVVERFTDEGLPSKATDQVFFYDIMLRIRAAGGSEIDFAKIRRFIFFLATTCRFQIRGITFDSWQSTDSIQIFNKAWRPLKKAKFSFLAKELSVDRTPGPYRTLRSVIMEQRFDAYQYDPFYDEVTKLVDFTLEGGKKIDHLPGESKDVSDSVAGATSATLLSKGKPISGSESEDILNRAKKYQASNVIPMRVDDARWVASGYNLKNPLDKFFDDK